MEAAFHACLWAGGRVHAIARWLDLHPLRRSLIEDECGRYGRTHQFHRRVGHAERRGVQAMKQLEQIPMFDLPAAPEDACEKPSERPVVKKPRHPASAKQLSLDVRLYVVRTGTAECTVQARSPS